MSLYRKAKPGELVVNNVVNKATAVTAVVDANSRQGVYADKEQRKAYQREWMRAKRAKAKQSSPPPDLKGIWLLVAELG